MYSKSESDREYYLKNYKQWEEFQIDIGAKSISIKEIIAKVQHITIVYARRTDFMLTGDRYDLSNENLKITLGQSPEFNFTEFLLFLLRRDFTVLDNVERLADVISHTFVRTSSAVIVKDDHLETILDAQRRHAHTSRSLIPCIKSFEMLRVKDSSFAPYIQVIELDYTMRPPFPRMLSPFRSEHINFGPNGLTQAINENFLDWVFDNRHDTNVSKEQIREGYRLFVEKARSILDSWPTPMLGEE